MLLLSYMFVRKYTYEQIRHEFSVDIEISDEPIADMFSFCREVLIIDLAHQHTTRGKIGGNGCVVQVDEMKLGKRKHNVGRVVDGNWIFGAIDDQTNELRIEVCTENYRSSEVLHALILKHVEVGTEIRSNSLASRSIDVPKKCLSMYSQISHAVSKCLTFILMTSDMVYSS